MIHSTYLIYRYQLRFKTVIDKLVFNNRSVCKLEVDRIVYEQSWLPRLNNIIEPMLSKRGIILLSEATFLEDEDKVLVTFVNDLPF